MAKPNLIMTERLLTLLGQQDQPVTSHFLARLTQYKITAVARCCVHLAQRGLIHRCPWIILPRIGGRGRRPIAWASGPGAAPAAGPITRYRRINPEIGITEEDLQWMEHYRAQREAREQRRA